MSSNRSFSRFCRTFCLIHFVAIIIGCMAIYCLLLHGKRAIVMSKLERIPISCETRGRSFREVLSIVQHESSCGGVLFCVDSSMISDQKLDKSIPMVINKGCPLRYILEDACDIARVEMSFSLFSRSVTLQEKQIRSFESVNPPVFHELPGSIRDMNVY